jgi:catechol 2,3-dioxygenase-like lactoylglutathione lyase family enzyme
MSRRLQLALNVNDIDQAVAFYAKLFGTEPAKVRPGYANFAIAEPPLKLVLLENPGQGGSLNHLGVEVADTGTVDAEQARFGRGRARAGRRARHDLLLRAAGQVLGEGRPGRRILGVLHGPGRQRDLLR